MINEFSIVVPVFNEIDNLRTLQSRIVASMQKTGIEKWEAILIDDGSTDGSDSVLEQIQQEDPRFKVYHFSKNEGQTAAFRAGFEVASYSTIGTLDADLQNDPFDFALLIPHLKENVGIVSGIRINRKDSRIKKVSSKLANWVRNRLTHDSTTDTGCSLKIYRAEALKKIKLFKGMHRFLPTLIKHEGYDSHEVPVGHHPRFSGVSKYGTLKRGWVGFFDLLAVRWMKRKRISYKVINYSNPNPAEAIKENDKRA